MTTTTDNIISAFSSLLGEGRVKTDEATRRNFALGDLLPECVVSPGSDEQVAAVLRRAGEMDLAVLPCRNGTKLGVGNLPSRYDVALCLREMNRIWHYEPKDLTVTVEAGMKLFDFEYFVGKSGLWLPLDPPFEGKASIGGVLASNSSGPSRLFYGQPRDMTLGMRVAGADGKLIKTGGRVVKNVTGYDLSKLMIGSFGTLGVITQASFKLYPLPPARRSFRLRLRELFQVCDFRRRLSVLPIAPLAVDFMDEKAARQYIKIKDKFNPDQSAQAKIKLHEHISSKPVFCSDCHQKDGYLDYAKLGFPTQRINHLNSTEVVGMIEKYKTFYLPSEIDFGVENTFGK